MKLQREIAQTSDSSNCTKYVQYSLSVCRFTDVPVIGLEFGTNQASQADGIREGADVYFECNIKANPWVYKVTWKHNVS